MARWWLLSACLGAIWWQSAVSAVEPALNLTEAQRAYQEQRSRARELIHLRAAREAQERRERIAARKRAGVSLSRPMHSGFPYQPTLPHGVANRQAQFARGIAVR